MSTNLQRVGSPEVVVLIAKANRVRYSRSPWAASVTLSGCSDGTSEDLPNGTLGTVCYFWSAA